MPYPSLIRWGRPVRPRPPPCWATSPEQGQHAVAEARAPNAQQPCLSQAEVSTTVANTLAYPQASPLATALVARRLGLWPMDRTICHGFANACVCPACAKRATRPEHASLPARQPWEAKAAA